MLILTGKDGVPLIPFPLHGTRLDGALHLSMHFDLEMTDLRETQAVPDDLIAALGVGEGVIAVATLEAGIAWGLTSAETAEEGSKGFVEPFEDILLDLAMDALVFFPQLLES